MAHFLDFCVTQKWRRAIGAHAAGVKPVVAVQRAFVVLGNRKQFCCLAIAKRVKRNLSSFEQLLNNNFGAGRAERQN